MTASPDQIFSSFLARQRFLLLKEREAEVERSSLLLSNCGPKLLEQKGLSLGGLGIASVNIGLGGKTLVELERPTAYHTTPVFPPHNLRPGDIARIEVNVPFGGPSKKAKKSTSDVKGSQTEGVVYKVTDTRIVVSLDPSDTSEDLDLPERCRVTKLANSVTYDRMDRTLDQLERTVNRTSSNGSTQELTKLMEVLLGMTSRSERLELQNIKFFDESLNDSQKEAVKFCLESPEVACIHGPPGTGKTHTLIEIIRQLTTVSPVNSKAQRLLVCGASNLSVDNILERLLALPPGEKGERLKFTRIGHPARVMAHEGILDSTLEVKASRTEQAALAKDVKNELETTLGILSGKGKGVKGKGPRGAERRKMWEEVKALRKEYRQREGGVVKSVLSESQIVLATCHSAGGRQLHNHDFDVVIIDEATQALEAVCWIPIFKGRKLILAGDSMQLPPTVLSLNKQLSSKERSKNTDPNVIRSKDSAATRKEPKEHVTPVAAPDFPPHSSPPIEQEQDSDPSNSSNDVTSEDEAFAPVVSPHIDSSNILKAKRNKLPVLRPPRTLETTLFDRLEKMYGSSIKRMLKVQYRMHAHICAFPSKALYSSKLISHSSVATHLLRDLPGTHADSVEGKKETLETPVVFFDTAGCEYYERLDGDGDEGSRCNENEATIVKNWVDELAEAGILPSQIAVISPYQAQVTLLTSLLRPKYGSGLEIGTVDGMQGREKDAVIISLVRSNDKREVGFLKEKRRLNVAMTRAKRHLCIVGDSSTVCHGGQYLKGWLAWLESNADVRYAGLE